MSEWSGTRSDRPTGAEQDSPTCARDPPALRAAPDEVRSRSDGKRCDTGRCFTGLGYEQADDPRQSPRRRRLAARVEGRTASLVRSPARRHRGLGRARRRHLRGGVVLQRRPRRDPHRGGIVTHRAGCQGGWGRRDHDPPPPVSSPLAARRLHVSVMPSCCEGWVTAKAVNAAAEPLPRGNFMRLAVPCGVSVATEAPLRAARLRLRPRGDAGPIECHRLGHRLGLSAARV